MKALSAGFSEDPAPPYSFPITVQNLSKIKLLKTAHFHVPHPHDIPEMTIYCIITVCYTVDSPSEMPYNQLNYIISKC
jgi:hypothetical protein